MSVHDILNRRICDIIDGTDTLAVKHKEHVQSTTLNIGEPYTICNASTCTVITRISYNEIQIVSWRLKKKVDCVKVSTMELPLSA